MLFGFKNTGCLMTLALALPGSTNLQAGVTPSKVAAAGAIGMVLAGAASSAIQEQATPVSSELRIEELDALLRAWMPKLEDLAEASSNLGARLIRAFGMADNPELLAELDSLGLEYHLQSVELRQHGAALERMTRFPDDDSIEPQTDRTIHTWAARPSHRTNSR